jgi:hypothetical protein
VGTSRASNSTVRTSSAAPLISAALYESDRSYVESLILRFLRHENPWIRGTSSMAAGHVARIHRALDTGKIVPLIEALLEDPGNRGRAQDALEDISWFLKD